MAQDPWTYSEEIMRKFYASYAATLCGSISKQSKPLDQDPLTSTMVRGCLVDISQATISRFLYGPTTCHSLSLNTMEFDYRWNIVRRDGERAEWVATPQLGIRKATLNFAAKFFWLLAELASLGTNVDAILATPIVEPEAAPTILADDTVLDALFSGTAEEGPEHTHAKCKRHCSSLIEEEKAQKRQRRQEKKARKASILDEELHQQRVRESVAGASSSAPVVEVPPVVRDVVSTTDGAMMDDVGTTER
uniref:Putative plant transposon protein domain-containing protein n=1 Tax=Solanum tuberosum TaxID=4113 RepID=M1DV07_SOLTU